MKRSSQFFPLFRIELFSLPGLWLFVVCLVALHGIGLYIRYWLGHDIDLWLANHESGFEDMFTLLVVIYAGTNLFPPPTMGHIAANPPEFMFTRAIDRKMYFGAKQAVFLLLVLLPIIVHAVSTYFEPNLILATRQPEMSERGKAFLSHFDNVRIWPGDGDGEFLLHYVVPNGKIVYAWWKLWSCLFLAMLTFGWATWIARFQQRLPWFSLVYPCLCVIPFLISFLYGNRLFELYLSHPTVVISAVLLIGFAVYKFCQKEFERLEVV